MADGTDATTAAVRRRALARAEAGKSLSLDELTALLTADGEALETLLAIAARQRDLGWGETVTYSRKVFVPLTMLCRDHCHYCTFAKPPAKLDAPYLTPDEVVVDRGRRRPRRVQGGAVHAGGPAGGALPRGTRVARRTRLRLDAGLRAGRRHPRDRGHRAAAAPESGRDVL